jgi:hypothetical protein
MRTIVFFIPFVITLVGWLPSLIAATGERVAPRKTAELHGTRRQITKVSLSPKSATPQRISRMEKAARLPLYKTAQLNIF